MSKPSTNLILLTHKCGNSYFNKTFKKDPTLLQFLSDDLREKEMPGPSLEGLKGSKKSFANIRCRNFNTLSTMRILDLVNIEKTNIFLCIRHPASFFRSATKYHQESPEKWSLEQRYLHLKGQTLHEALVNEPNNDEKLIISMKHFGLAWQLPLRWLSNYHYLSSIGKDVTILKTEDLFMNGSDSFFKSVANKMSHDGYQIDASTLLKASPITMNSLPKHSTGEFKKDFFSGFGDKAIKFYNSHFKGIESELYKSSR